MANPMKGMIRRRRQRLPRLPPPIDPWTEPEWRAVRRAFWEVVGGGKMSLIFSVVTLLVGAAAAYVAQSNDIHPLPTAAWAVGTGLATIAVLCGCALLVTWHRTLVTQRNAAADEVIRLRRLVHPDFPAHNLTIKCPWYLDAPDKDDPESTVRLLFLPIRYTNRWAGRGVSLQIDLIWRRVLDGKVELGPSKVFHSKYSADLPEAFEMPLHVEADRTVQGNLVFEPWESWLFHYGDTAEVWVRPPFQISLRLTDEVSGATIDYPVPDRRPEDDEQG